MTFYEHKQVTWQGRESLTENRRYTVKWQLRSNDADDGPQQAIAYFAATPGLPDPLQSYAIGNDVYTDLFLTSLDPVLNVNKCSEFDFVWDVTGVYEPIDDQESSEDESGNPTSDPLQFRRRFDITFSHQNVDAINGRFVGCYNGLTDATPQGFPYSGVGAPANAYSRLADSIGRVEHSGGIAYDPPYQKTESDIVLRIGYNSATYDTGWWAYRNSVNKSQVYLNSAFFGISNWVFPKWTLRMEAIDATFRFTNGVRYWDMTWEMHFREGEVLAGNEVAGWSEMLPDIGYPSRREGEPDGQGGNVPALPGGAAANANPLDFDAKSINTPVPLNGDGQAEQGNAQYWNRYLFPRDQPYESLPLGFSLTPAP